MEATKNKNFPFITVTSADLTYNGQKLGSVSGMGAIIENSNPNTLAVNCVDLVYHANLNTVKTYQRSLQK